MKIIVMNQEETDISLYDELFKVENTELFICNDMESVLNTLNTVDVQLVISHQDFNEVSGINAITSCKKMHQNIKSILLTEDPSLELELEAIDQGIDLVLNMNQSKRLIQRYIKRLYDEIKPITQLNIIESKFEKITINVESRQVYKDGVEMELSKREYDLLKYLLENQGTILTREQIVTNIWKKQLDSVSLRSVDIQIKNIRSKLNIYSITSIRGYGYTWNEYK